MKNDVPPNVVLAGYRGPYIPRTPVLMTEIQKEIAQEARAEANWGRRAYTRHPDRPPGRKPRSPSELSSP